MVPILSYMNLYSSLASRVSVAMFRSPVCAPVLWLLLITDYTSKSQNSYIINQIYNCMSFKHCNDIDVCTRLVKSNRPLSFSVSHTWQTRWKVFEIIQNCCACCEYFVHRIWHPNYVNGNENKVIIIRRGNSSLPVWFEPCYHAGCLFGGMYAPSVISGTRKITLWFFLSCEQEPGLGFWKNCGGNPHRSGSDDGILI